MGGASHVEQRDEGVRSRNRLCRCSRARSSRRGESTGCRGCHAPLATRESGLGPEAVGSQHRPVGVGTSLFGDSAQLLPGSGRLGASAGSGETSKEGVCLARRGGSEDWEWGDRWEDQRKGSRVTQIRTVDGGMWMWRVDS